MIGLELLMAGHDNVLDFRIENPHPFMRGMGLDIFPISPSPIKGFEVHVSPVLTTVDDRSRKRALSSGAASFTLFTPTLRVIIIIRADIVCSRCHGQKR